jgi:hypothetical protein
MLKLSAAGYEKPENRRRALKSKPSVRHRSQQTLFGLPLIDIASGPDREHGEKPD